MFGHFQYDQKVQDGILYAALQFPKSNMPLPLTSKSWNHAPRSYAFQIPWN